MTSAHIEESDCRSAILVEPIDMATYFLSGVMGRRLELADPDAEESHPQSQCAVEQSERGRLVGHVTATSQHRFRWPH